MKLPFLIQTAPPWLVNSADTPHELCPIFDEGILDGICTKNWISY
ncbi:hypothetical protein [Methanobacterium congolense]|nr:hypothetical protein [Methanobacterium congolense]